MSMIQFLFNVRGDRQTISYRKSCEKSPGGQAYAHYSVNKLTITTQLSERLPRCSAADEAAREALTRL